MNFQPSHNNLYFSPAQMAVAQTQRKEDPFAAAWARLMGAVPEDSFAAWMYQTYRYRFAEDLPAGEQALNWLSSIQNPNGTRLEQIRQVVALLHGWTMLHDHPAASSAKPALLPLVETLLAQPEAITPLEQTWLNTLQIVSGIVFNNAAVFETGAAGFRQVIDHDIHVEGYIKSAVTDKSNTTFLRQMQMVCALTLAAEAAFHAGVNLWQYETRGVSVVTAAAYLVYYYFYPEKWRWSDENNLTLAQTQQLFREHGAFMEIVTYRAQPRSVELLLNEQRPMFDAWGGGMTTLSHGKAFPRKKRGLFGR